CERTRRPPGPTVFPSTTLFRSGGLEGRRGAMSDPRRWMDEGGDATRRERDLLAAGMSMEPPGAAKDQVWAALLAQIGPLGGGPRSEEHTSELQSRENLVCRLLL